ncbi:MAG: hypothetical protein AB7S74_14070 [Hyphomicrobium sp.]
MGSVFVRVVAVAMVFTFPLHSAEACNGDKVLFEEKFEFADPAWGWNSQSEVFKIGDGKAIIRATQNTTAWASNAAFLFDNVDICYTSILTEQTSDPTNSFSGLMFWFVDNENFFALYTASNGYFKVARRIAGQWAADPIKWTTTDVLKQGPNQANKVRVRLEDQTITVEINDKQVIKFRGQAPGRPTSIGFLASSAPSSVDSWAFSDLKVTNIK